MSIIAKLARYIKKHLPHLPKPKTTGRGGDFE